MRKNESLAVMQRRIEPANSRDFFPTPPWATRALLKYPLKRYIEPEHVALEPSCGRGHMSVPLLEYFHNVRSYDVEPYGFGGVRDFLATSYRTDYYDWVITNPPFNLALEFIHKSLPIARCGVAMLVRTSFLESVKRYRRLFRHNPPSIVAQFVERVPMLKGKLKRKASTATSYAWLIWLTPPHVSNTHRYPRIYWIPPCRERLEFNRDYKRSTYAPVKNRSKGRRTL